MDKNSCFESYLRKAFDVALSPGRSTAKPMTMQESLRFYYNIMVIPLILGVLISLLVGGIASAGLVVLALLVIVPISVFINSAIYHLIIGMLFNIYRSDYERVFSAFTYGIVPVVLVYWLVRVPLIGVIIAGIFAIWGYVVQIIALSNILRMSRLKAFATTLLSGIVLAFVVMLVSSVFAIGVFTGLRTLGI